MLNCPSESKDVKAEWIGGGKCTGLQGCRIEEGGGGGILVRRIGAEPMARVASFCTVLILKLYGLHLYHFGWNSQSVTRLCRISRSQT